MGKRFSKSLGRRTHSKTEARISTLDEDEALGILDSLEEDPFFQFVQRRKLTGYRAHGESTLEEILQTRNPRP